MKQLRKDQRIAIFWTIVIFLLIALFLFAAIRFKWGWTGLLSYTTTTTTTEIKSGSPSITTATTTHPHKTLWDALTLAIIPFVLAVAAFLFNRAQRKSEQEIAANREQEMLLQNYLDAMTELILDRDLRGTKKDVKEDAKEVDAEKKIDLRNVARSRTLTVLRALDANNYDGKNRRRGSLVRFLYETQLISGEEPVISLKKANLEVAYMRLFDLRDANLQNTSLYKADLRGANLEEANLEGAYMQKANLCGTNLSNAKLKNADLKGAIYGPYAGNDTRWPENFVLSGTGALEMKDDSER